MSRTILFKFTDVDYNKLVEFAEVRFPYMAIRDEIADYMDSPNLDLKYKYKTNKGRTCYIFRRDKHSWDK